MWRWVPGRRIGGLLLVVVLGWASGPALAEQYLVNAAAGNEGDAAVDQDDPDASASFSRVDVGSELYEASADASSGGVFASASRTDPLPPAAISTRAAAGIEETIVFDELPADSVTIEATMGIEVFAARTVGAANASARLTLVASTGECSFLRSYNAALGPSEEPACNAIGGSAGGGTVTLVLTRDQLLASNLQVDIEINVSAQLESIGGIDGSAIAAGGVGFSRGPAVPGTVFVDIDPPLAHHYVGSMTAFPTSVPEPGAPALLAVGAATLLACGRRRARARREVAR